MHTCRVSDMEKLVGDIAPYELAEEWDNVGLLVGRFGGGPGVGVGRRAVGGWAGVPRGGKRGDGRCLGGAVGRRRDGRVLQIEGFAVARRGAPLAGRLGGRWFFHG